MSSHRHWCHFHDGYLGIQGMRSDVFINTTPNNTIPLDGFPSSNGHGEAKCYHCKAGSFLRDRSCGYERQRNNLVCTEVHCDILNRWDPTRDVPLNLALVGDDGKLTVERSLVLKEKEMEIPLDTNKLYKLNFDSSAVGASQFFCSIALS